MNESSLIDAARPGNVEAFNTLILRYQDLVYNVAYRSCLSRARAKMGKYLLIRAAM